jgi:quercetin dioxygenase-like cupin family protein
MIVFCSGRFTDKQVKPNLENMDTSQLKNGKYFCGQYKDSDHPGGWFVASFFDENNPCKTDQLEITYKEHPIGNVIAPHYHKIKVELLIILEGKAKYTINENEVILNKGDFLFVDVNNVISGKFLEPTKLFAIHSPSIVTDKTVVE